MKAAPAPASGPPPNTSSFPAFALDPLCHEVTTTAFITGTVDHDVVPRLVLHRSVVPYACAFNLDLHSDFNTSDSWRSGGRSDAMTHSLVASRMEKQRPSQGALSTPSAVAPQEDAAFTVKGHKGYTPSVETCAWYAKYEADHKTTRDFLAAHLNQFSTPHNGRESPPLNPAEPSATDATARSVKANQSSRSGGAKSIVAGAGLSPARASRAQALLSGSGGPSSSPPPAILDDVMFKRVAPFITALKNNGSSEALVTKHNVMSQCHRAAVSHHLPAPTSATEGSFLPPSLGGVGGRVPFHDVVRDRHVSCAEYVDPGRNDFYVDVLDKEAASMLRHCVSLKRLCLRLYTWRVNCSDSTLSRLGTPCKEFIPTLKKQERCMPVGICDPYVQAVNSVSGKDMSTFLKEIAAPALSSRTSRSNGATNARGSIAIPAPRRGFHSPPPKSEEAMNIASSLEHLVLDGTTPGWSTSSGGDVLHQTGNCLTPVLSFIVHHCPALTALTIRGELKPRQLQELAEMNAALALVRSKKNKQSLPPGPQGLKPRAPTSRGKSSTSTGPRASVSGSGIAATRVRRQRTSTAATASQHDRAKVNDDADSGEPVISLNANLDMLFRRAKAFDELVAFDHDNDDSEAAAMNARIRRQSQAHATTGSDVKTKTSLFPTLLHPSPAVGGGVAPRMDASSHGLRRLALSFFARSIKPEYLQILTGAFPSLQSFTIYTHNDHNIRTDNNASFASWKLFFDSAPHISELAASGDLLMLWLTCFDDDFLAIAREADRDMITASSPSAVSNEEHGPHGAESRGAETLGRSVWRLPFPPRRLTSIVSLTDAVMLPGFHFRVALAGRSLVRLQCRNLGPLCFLNAASYSVFRDCRRGPRGEYASKETEDYPELFSDFVASILQVNGRFLTLSPEQKADPKKRASLLAQIDANVRQVAKAADMILGVDVDTFRHIQPFTLLHQSVVLRPDDDVDDATSITHGEDFLPVMVIESALRVPPASIDLTSDNAVRAFSRGHFADLETLSFSEWKSAMDRHPDAKVPDFMRGIALAFLQHRVATARSPLPPSKDHQLLNDRTATTSSTAAPAPGPPPAQQALSQRQVESAPSAVVPMERGGPKELSRLTELTVPLDVVPTAFIREGSGCVLDKIVVTDCFRVIRDAATNTRLIPTRSLVGALSFKSNGFSESVTTAEKTAGAVPWSLTSVDGPNDVGQNHTIRFVRVVARHAMAQTLNRDRRFWEMPLLHHGLCELSLIATNVAVIAIEPDVKLPIFQPPPDATSVKITPQISMLAQALLLFQGLRSVVFFSNSAGPIARVVAMAANKLLGEGRPGAGSVIRRAHFREPLFVEAKTGPFQIDITSS